MTARLYVLEGHRAALVEGPRVRRRTAQLLPRLGERAFARPAMDHPAPGQIRAVTYSQRLGPLFDVLTDDSRWLDSLTLDQIDRLEA